jgi:PleD family two-component response regulator
MDKAKRKVLVIDDDPLVTRYLEMILVRQFNALTFSAHNPKAGFDYLDANKPDLIILDMEMPLMDGYTMLKTIRSVPGTSDIPVIICSALSTPELFAGLVKLKISDYIVKPLAADIVIQKIRNVLDKTS